MKSFWYLDHSILLYLSTGKFCMFLLIERDRFLLW